MRCNKADQLARRGKSVDTYNRSSNIVLLLYGIDNFHESSKVRGISPLGVIYRAMIFRYFSIQMRGKYHGND